MALSGDQSHAGVFHCGRGDQMYKPVTYCLMHNVRRNADRYGADWVSIGILPDEVLLHAFHFYRADTMDALNGTWGWHRLAHVCRRWRQIIFESQHSLDLRLLCTEKTPIRRTLDVWPPLPIIMECRISRTILQRHNQVTEESTGDDLVAALEHPDRIHQITVCGPTDLLLGKIASVMLEPFRVLTHLRLQVESCDDSDTATALPDGFLGGFAPRLQRVWLEGIPFPALPDILLSANDLVELRLDKIPDTWHISSGTLATALSKLPRLVSLSIEFQSPQLHPDQTSQDSPPPLPRAVLPSLAILFFKGVSEYFEDLVARIDTPRLSYTFIKFFNQLIFDVSHLPKFVVRTEKLRSLNRAEVFFDRQGVGIGFYLPETTGPRNLTLRILCSQSDWQLSSLTQLCNQSWPLLSRVERLDIRECPSSPREPQWQDKMQWVDLFHPFTALKALHIPRELGPRIAPVLQELTEARAAEVLPALDSLVVEDLESSEVLQGAVQRFIAARGFAGRPVDVRRWDDKWGRDLEWEWDLAREWERRLEVDD